MLNFLKYKNYLGWPPSKSKVQSTVSKNSILNYPHIRHKIYDICKNSLTIKYLPKWLRNKTLECILIPGEAIKYQLSK